MPRLSTESEKNTVCDNDLKAFLDALPDVASVVLVIAGQASQLGSKPASSKVFLSCDSGGHRVRPAPAGHSYGVPPSTPSANGRLAMASRVDSVTSPAT